MSYRNNYTYGEKTTAQIKALTGMTQGQTVWNNEYHRMEWYTGSVWLNEMGATVIAGETLVQGELVGISVAGKALKMIDGDEVWGIGVVHHGGVLDDVVCIINMGQCLVMGGATTVLGQYATLHASTAGRMNDTTAASSGTFGRITEAGSTGVLSWVMLVFIERG
jgi:hypothetical protein